MDAIRNSLKLLTIFPQHGHIIFFFSVANFLRFFPYSIWQCSSCFFSFSSQHLEQTTISKHGSKIMSQGLDMQAIQTHVGDIGSLVISDATESLASIISSSHTFWLGSAASSVCFLESMLMCTILFRNCAGDIRLLLSNEENSRILSARS